MVLWNAKPLRVTLFNLYNKSANKGGIILYHKSVNQGLHRLYSFLKIISDLTAKFTYLIFSLLSTPSYWLAKSHFTFFLYLDFIFKNENWINIAIKWGYILPSFHPLILVPQNIPHPCTGLSWICNPILHNKIRIWVLC